MKTPFFIQRRQDGKDNFVSADIDLEELQRTLPSLDELNSSENMRLLPLVVYLMLVAIFGILGNGLVCHVYRTRYKLSNSQCFILMLSFIDLFSCLLVIPFETIVVLHQFNFRYPWVCKMARFFNTWPNVSSGFILVSIALDRYRKVCVPLSRQLSFKMAKWMCAGSVLIGLLFSWPALVMYGKKRFLVEKYNITATECSIDDSFKDSKFPFINNAIFGCLFLTGSSSLTVLYSLIGRQINRLDAVSRARKKSSLGLNVGHSHQEQKSKSIGQSRPSNSLRDESSSAEGHSLATPGATVDIEQSLTADDHESVFPENGEIKDKLPPLRSLSSEHSNQGERQSLNSCSSPSESEQKTGRKGILKKVSTGSGRPSTGSANMINNGSYETPVSARIHERQHRRVRQMTLLMFLISLAYFLSYLPHVLLMLLRAVNSGFVDAMTDQGRAAYKFFLRSYALNAVVNPFIYGICDARFRRASRMVYSGWCRPRRSNSTRTRRA